jgi:hypothetical protein
MKSFDIRTSLKTAAFGVGMLALLAGPVAMVRAQDATPEAEPIDLVETAEACGTFLGIGAETDSCVLILHLAPDAPAVDVWVNGAKALENVEFGMDSGYIALPAGDHDVVIVPAGGEAADAVFEGALTLEAGIVYHVAAVGTLAEGDEAEFGVEVYDRTVGTFAEGNAIIEVMHTSPDAPAVDVALKGGDVLIADLEWLEVSDDLGVPAGSYDLEVRAAGTDTVALDLPGVEVEAGKIYSVYAIGTLNADDDQDLTVKVIVTEPKSDM